MAAYPQLDRIAEQDVKEVSAAKLGLELDAVDIHSETMSKRQNVRARLNANPISNVRAQRMRGVQSIATLSIWH
jgi:hypothetical protein